MIARNDLTLNPAHNGEYWIQDKILATFSKDYNYLMFDIGANIGEWSTSIVNKSKNKNGALHLFEPASDSYEFLVNLYKNKSTVKVNNIAISNKTGESTLYIVDSMSATNSLYKSDFKLEQKVQTITFDNYVNSEKITHIDFVKSDTEGNDFNILLGAEEAMKKGIIDIWQFEYNVKWIYARHFLKDVFCFIEDKDYVLAKISKNGVEIFDEWHPELERFFEANYLLIKKNNKFIQNLSKHVMFDHYNVLVSKI